MTTPRRLRAHEDRVAALEQRRDLKMARSAHAYVRGSTERFYDWLASAEARRIPEGPAIWICGVAHVGNLGPIARRDERVDVEVRDLDQTVIGNPSHDLVRLGLSLAMAARSSDLPGVITARLIEELMAGYLDGLRPDEGKRDRRPPGGAESATVRFVVREALHRKWRHLHRERLGKRPKLRLGKRFWPLTKDERVDVERFLDTERVRSLVTALDCRADDAQIRVTDAAFWVKGCSSLGLWRCAALVEVVGHDKKAGGYSILDIKQAVQPLAPTADHAEMPSHYGERVVRGARALSPALGGRMLWGTIAGRAIFVRELMPQDLKLELEMLDETEARATARTLAHLVGRAHARQLDPRARGSLRASLARAATKLLDAPSWLWASVIGLVAVHEQAYLDHCRRYALALEKARGATRP